MFLSAKAYFEDHTKQTNALLIRAETMMPQLWLTRFKKNVAPLTPLNETGYLRRSIITQAMGNRAEVRWRAPYAQAQHAGGHDFPGQYKKYTTPGTGAHFGSKAFQKTNAELPAIARELGLTK